MVVGLQKSAPTAAAESKIKPNIINTYNCSKANRCIFNFERAKIKYIPASRSALVLNFFHNIRLNHIAELDVVKVLYADTALIAGRNFLRIVLESFE